MKLTEKIVKTSATDFGYIKNFMKRVFPKEELFPMFLLMAVSKLKRSHFLAFYEKKQFIGILYIIEFPNLSILSTSPSMKPSILRDMAQNSSTWSGRGFRVKLALYLWKP